MKRFIVKVELTASYFIDLDEEAFTEEEFMEDHKKAFYGFETLEEHAEHIAQFRVRFGDTECMEGYYGMGDKYEVTQRYEDVETKIM